MTDLFFNFSVSCVDGMKPLETSLRLVVTPAPGDVLRINGDLFTVLCVLPTLADDTKNVCLEML
jgi:hypothetical protein